MQDGDDKDLLPPFYLAGQEMTVCCSYNTWASLNRANEW